MGHSRPLFIYFRLFNSVDNKQVNKQMFNKILPMTGVKLRTSGFESHRSTNWATTTSPPKSVLPDLFPNQCDQIGRFIALWATFPSLWQQLFWSNQVHFKQFFKLSKSFILLGKLFLGNFYGHLAIILLVTLVIQKLEL